MISSFMITFKKKVIHQVFIGLLTRDPAKALSNDDKSKLDVRDLQLEMSYHIKREFVEFDKFDGYQKCANKFKETLCSFQGDMKDSFLILFCTGFFLSFQNVIKLIKKG